MINPKCQGETALCACLWRVAVVVLVSVGRPAHCGWHLSLAAIFDV